MTDADESDDDPGVWRERGLPRRWGAAGSEQDQHHRHQQGKWACSVHRTLLWCLRVTVAVDHAVEYHHSSRRNTRMGKSGSWRGEDTARVLRRCPGCWAPWLAVP